jgi:carbamoylphosphate synthase large subunit
LRLGREQPGLNHRKFIAAKPKIVMLADDKSAFNAFLLDHGYGRFLPRPAEPDEIPFVVKRRRDTGGQHTRLIGDSDERLNWQHLYDDPDYFCQEFVPGDTEYTTHLIYLDGIRYSCTIRFDMNRQHYIRGARMQPYRNVQISIVDSEFDSIFDDILASLGFEGICCFNYKIIGGQPVIFELNPRFGGSLPRDIDNFLIAMMKTLSGIRQ